MAQRFIGVFTGSTFCGLYAGRCGEITYQDGSHSLGIYWELGVNGISVGSIPYMWAAPPGETLTEQRQLEILDSLKEWLRSNNVPNNPADEPWVSAPDEDGCKCAWVRCDNTRVLGYAICRGHLNRGYLASRLERPSNQRVWTPPSSKGS